ncbi:hypothetical protein [Sphingorhabdus sp.]|uniref:hypothetical protein n=1 Tax=Sphingorhabdus sp. TaxID=1902408 RepID=UPI0032B71CE5
MKFHSKTFTVACALLAGVASQPAFAQDQSSSNATTSADDKGVLRFSTGINYSKGDYGELTDTKVVSAPVSLKYSKDNFSIRVSVPYVRIDGPGSLIQTPEGRDGGSGSGGRTDNSGPGSANSGSGSGSSGEVEVDNSGGAPVSSRRSGFGDVVIASTYSFDLGNDFYIDATGKVKIPTASKAKRLGTGKVDVTAALDFVKEFGPTTLYVHGRRKFAGSSTTVQLRDTWGAGAGASVRAGNGVTVGADYDWQQSSIVGNQASSEVTGWASFRLAKGFNMSIFGSTGLNRNSTDFAGGLSLSIRLN